jgi:ribose transport system ATP-binding protein
MQGNVTSDTQRTGGSTEPELAVDAIGLRKVYGPTTALADVSLQVRAGEIHGLLGENGAGKSTLVRLLAGVEQPDGGALRFFGEDAVGGPSKRRKAGLAFIHQDLGLFDAFSVADNVALWCGFQRRGVVISQTATVARARDVAGRLGFDVDVTKLVGELTLADQTLVAVCRALAEGARLIVMDEPTAYLEAQQVRKLLTLLSRLRDDGVACVFITHRSEDVLRICDRVTVLRDGKDVARRETSGLAEKELIQLITGRPETTSAASQRGQPASARPVRLRAHCLCGPGFGPVSFTIRAGEIVGLCGLADAGQFSVGRAVVGNLPVASGDLSFEGKPYHPRSVGDALSAGIGFVPANRARDGLAGSLSAAENLLMKPAGSWWHPLRRGADKATSMRLLETFRVRPAAPEREVATFSGGNQQKILLAKWLGSGRRLVVLNEPSAGVDIGAKADIHSQIRLDCEQNDTAGLVISTDFMEIADLCDRALVMRRGVIVGELARDQLHPDRLAEMAYGGTA